MSAETVAETKAAMQAAMQAYDTAWEAAGRPAPGTPGWDQLAGLRAADGQAAEAHTIALLDAEAEAG